MVMMSLLLFLEQLVAKLSAKLWLACRNNLTVYRLIIKDTCMMSKIKLSLADNIMTILILYIDDYFSTFKINTVLVRIMGIIIQYIHTLPKYGKNALDVRRSTCP